MTDIHMLPDHSNNPKPVTWTVTGDTATATVEGLGDIKIEIYRGGWQAYINGYGWWWSSRGNYRTIHFAVSRAETDIRQWAYIDQYKVKP